MTLEEFKKFDLPDSPGVYFFHDAEGNLLYIGKATSLRSRVRSYFAEDLAEKRGLKIVTMVTNAADIKYQVTDSVLEALLLENQLIKKNQPPYNSKEKDNRSYMCVVITKEEFPRVLTMRVREYEKRFILKNIENLKVDVVYGPFSNGTQIRDAMKIVRKMFPYRDKCEPGSNKPCFNCQIKLCPGICIGKVTSEEYKNTIKHIKDFFNGKKAKIKKELKDEMDDYANRQEFEKAAKIRNTLFAIDHIKDVSLIKDEELLEFKDKGFRIEAYDVAHISGSNRVGVMTVIIDGKLAKDEYRKFKLVENVNDDYMGLAEIIKRRFKHTEWRFPDLIVFDGGKGQKNIGDQILTKLNLSIQTVAVVKNDKHKAREILGINNLSTDLIDKKTHSRLEKSIILCNAEAHRFAINYHKDLRDNKIY
jgi:excinuclease ABC subunit C